MDLITAVNVALRGDHVSGHLLARAAEAAATLHVLDPSFAAAIAVAVAKHAQRFDAAEAARALKACEEPALARALWTAGGNATSSTRVAAYEAAPSALHPAIA